MGKRYRKMTKKSNGKIREIKDERVVLELPLPIADVLAGIPHAVEELSYEAGLMLVMAVIKSECEKIAGVKDAKNPLRTVNWWGSQIGSIYYGKQKVSIERPRLRGKDNKEIALNTYKAFQNPNGMNSTVMKQLILGISSRNYEEAIEGFIKGHGIKKSSISRHFVKATAEQMREFMERDISNFELCAIFVDGIEFKGHLLVVALGLDKEGKKHILGLWQGATENSTVCNNLLNDIERRGLDMNREYLFVLDGSKALRSSVARKFGSEVFVQRCQQHKRRNVKDHLPPEHQEAIDARIRAAYNMADYDKAKESLDLTIRCLERLNPSAAASLKEGLEETLTLHRLGVTGLLRKSLSTTNPIESCFSVTRTVTGRVKKWNGGDMVQRWAVAALLRAEKRFKRVKGYREIPKLIAALQQRNFDKKEVAA
jgi:transposase-like protein